MTTFYCLRFETPPAWRGRSSYLYSLGTGWPLGSLFVASYDSQGYGGGIRPSLLITPLHGPSSKHRFQQYLYCSMRIRCHGNIFTAPLPRDGSDIFISRSLRTRCNMILTNKTIITICDLYTTLHTNTTLCITTSSAGSIEEWDDCFSQTPLMMATYTLCNYKQITLKLGRAFLTLTAHCNGGSGRYVITTLRFLVITGCFLIILNHVKRFIIVLVWRETWSKRKGSRLYAGSDAVTNVLRKRAASIFRIIGYAAGANSPSPIGQHSVSFVCTPAVPLGSHFCPENGGGTFFQMFIIMFQSTRRHIAHLFSMLRQLILYV
jgi:hypothetical protein